MAIGGIAPITSFIGNLDELRIWKFPITQDQILQNYQRPLNFNSDLVTVFGFDEETNLSNGASISDNSGMFTGTISGANISIFDDRPTYLPANELNYQWFEVGNATAISTNDSLVISTADFIDSAEYFVLINNTLNCGPDSSRIIKIKENLISDELFASDTVFCEGTDSARIWVDLNVYDTVFVYSTQTGVFDTLSSATDTAYVSQTDTVYGIIHNWIDGKLCTQITDTVTVEAYENPVLNIVRDSIIICFDSALVLFDPAFGDTIIEGDGIVNTYAWSPNFNLSDSTILNTVYSANPDTVLPFILRITDNNGCFDSDTVVAETNPRIEVTLQSDTTICFGTSLNLGFNNSITGGKAPGNFSYQWDNDTLFQNPADVTNLNALIDGDSAGVNTYGLVVTDIQTGCIGLDTVVVVVNDSIDFTALNLIDTICFNTPSIVIGGFPTAQADSGILSYAWFPALHLDDTTLSNPTFTNPSIAGTYAYNVTATDNVNCSRTSNTVTVEVAPDVIVDAGVGDTVCYGDSSQVLGPIGPVATGGFGRFSYAWSILSPAGLNATDYLNDTTLEKPIIYPSQPFTEDTIIFIVTVYDSSIALPRTSCNYSDTTIVIFNNEILVDAGSEDFACYDSTETLLGSATGGTGSFTYLWSGDISLLADPTDPNSTLTGSTSGFYNLVLTATDATYNSCFNFDTLDFEVNQELFANAGADDSVCYGESLILGGSPTASGGTPDYTFSWTQLSGTTSNLINPTDSVPIFNQSGLTSGGIYIYEVAIADARFCTNRDTISINVNNEFIFSPVSPQSVCLNDSLPVGATVSGGDNSIPYNYLWSSQNGNNFNDSDSLNTFLQPVLVGLDQVTLTVTDSRMCSDSIQFNVDVISLPVITLTPNGAPEICLNESILLDASASDVNPGALIYTWNDTTNVNPITVTPLDTTDYIMEVQNINTTCSQFDTVTVVVNPLPDLLFDDASTLNPIGIDSFSACDGTSPILEVNNSGPNSSAADTYLWSANPPTINFTPTNTDKLISFLSSDIDPNGNWISVLVTDAKTCANLDSVYIAKSAFPTATLDPTSDTICEGEQIQLIASNGPTPTFPTVRYSYRRNSPTSSAVFFSSTSTTNTNLFTPGLVNPPLVLDTVTNITYELEINDNGCKSILVTNVLVNPKPVLNTVTNSDTICFGDSVTMTISNSNPFPIPLDSAFWGHAPSYFDTIIQEQILASTVYSVSAVDTNGCISDAVSFNIISKDLPDVSLDAVGPISLCEGNDTLLSLVSPSSNYIYIWRDSSNLSVPPSGTINGSSYTADTTGNFFVEIVTTGASSFTQCRDTSNAVSVIVNPLPVISVDTIPNTSEFCFGDSVRLEDLNHPSSFYQWTEATLGTISTGTNFIYVSDSGQFKVIVTDLNGCIDSSAVLEFFELPLSSDSILGDDTVCAFSQTVYSSSTGNAGTWVLDQSFGVIQGASLISGDYVLSNSNTATITWATANNAQLYFTPSATLVDCPTEDTFDITIVANPVASIQGPTSGCFGDDIKLFALNGGDGYLWNIVQPNFGGLNLNNVDTTILSLNQPVSSTNGFDTSSIRLVQTDLQTGCTDTASVLITKYEFADAEFIVNPLDTAVCRDDTSSFSIQLPVPNALYTFTKISGPGQLLPSAVNGQQEIVWNAVGISVIRSIATNGDCADTVIHTFNIQQPPTNLFTYEVDNQTVDSVVNVCVNSDSVTYTLSVFNPANTYTWSVQSNPLGAANPLGALDTSFLSVSIDTPGSYVLTMIEETSNGCALTLSETVTINSIPTFDLQVFDTVICVTDSIQTYSYTGNLNITNLGWSISDPAIIVNNDPNNNQIVVNWSGPGTDKWIVPFYTQGDCEVDGDTVFMDIEALPNPFITPDASQIGNPNGDTVFCQNLRTFFIANPGDTAATYQWYLNGDPIANSDSSRLRILESGTYSFSIITSGGGCLDSTAIGVTADVLQIPEAEITGDTLWCGAGDSIELSSVNTAGVYEWFEAPGVDTTFIPRPNSNVRNISVGIFGEYYVVLTNAGGNGCTDTSDVFIISPLAPAVSLFRFDSITSFCNNDIIPLNGNSAGRLLEFEWTTNGQGVIVDPFTDTTTYLPSDLDSGNISFEFSVTNFCNEDISIDTADLRISPDASYTPSSLVAELDELVTFEVNTEDAILYSWVFGTGGTGTGPFVEHRYTQSGDFLSYLIAVNEFNCEDSFAVPIHVTRNQLIYVPNVFSPNATNPDNQVMRVYGTNISGTQFEIKIFNRWGIEVWSSENLSELKTNGWNGTQKGNGAELPSGVYTYYIKGQFFNGEAFQKVGTVSLIK